MKLIKTYKKGKVVVEVYHWGSDLMRIKIYFPSGQTAQFICDYDDKLVEFAPAKKFIIESIDLLNN